MLLLTYVIVLRLYSETGLKICSGAQNRTGSWSQIHGAKCYPALWKKLDENYTPEN